MNIKLLNSTHFINVLIATGLLVFIIGIIAFAWNEYLFSFGSPIKSDKAGQLGDFIGGIAGSLWALAGVILFYKALREQRIDFKNNKESLDLQVRALEQQIEEFKLNRKELESSRRVYETQSKTAKFQQFDSNFYSLVNVYLKIKNNLLIENPDFFEEILANFSNQNTQNNEISATHSKNIEEYIKTFVKNRDKLSNYFRVLYRIVKIIDSSIDFSDKEKWFYAKILRAQISDYELMLLFYNSYTSQGAKTRTYILKYNLLKHLPTLNKPEYKKIINIPYDQNLYTFCGEVENFIISHFDKFYDMNFEAPSIEEKMDSIDAYIGIYFGDDIDLKIIISNDVLKNRIFGLENNNFINFIYTFIYDKTVLCTYADIEKVKVIKSTESFDQETKFCIKITTQVKHQLNKDIY